jgi:hypothetical protein
MALTNGANPMTTPLFVKVAGVTFEGRQTYLAALKGDEPCRIVAEPDNAYDANALAVHVAMHDGNVRHVGYIPRDLAKRIAPLLEGEPLMITIVQILGGGLSFYGLLLRVDLPFTIYPDTEAEAYHYDYLDLSWGDGHEDA